MTREKFHTTVTLTLKDIRRLEPCRDGLDLARPFLPATISTDPEENIDLANALVEARVDLKWLFERFGGCLESYTLGCCEIASPRFCDFVGPLDDGFLVAQFLAILADRLAIRRSR